jgi:hypothetical protein
MKTTMYISQRLNQTADAAKRVAKNNAAVIGTAVVAFTLLGGTAGIAAAASTSSVDTNGDGYISTIEAAPFYGSIQASLTTSGDTSPASALALDRFPVASPSGSISYKQTITVSDTVMQEIEAGKAVIVQHGIDLNNDGAYDGAATSSVDASVPLEATIPADCGVLKMTGTDTATANLRPVNSPYSEAYGTVHAQISGDNITIEINSTGLSANLPHAQHIHIGGENMCPPESVATGMSSTSLGGTISQLVNAELANIHANVKVQVDALNQSIAQRFSNILNRTSY